MSDQSPDLAALLESFRKTFKRITHCRYNGHDLVFRKPTADEAQMYRSMPVDTGDQRFEQMSTLAQLILVHPPLSVWHELLDDYPFMLSNEGVNDAIATVMGVREEKKDSTSPAPPRKPIPTASPAASPSGSPSAPAAS